MSDFVFFSLIFAVCESIWKPHTDVTLQDQLVVFQTLLHAGFGLVSVKKRFKCPLHQHQIHVAFYLKLRDNIVRTD